MDCTSTECVRGNFLILPWDKPTAISVESRHFKNCANYATKSGSGKEHFSGFFHIVLFYSPFSFSAAVGIEKRPPRLDEICFVLEYS